MKKKKSLTKFLGGGVADTAATSSATSGAAGGGMGSLYSQIPGILDQVISVIENNPKAYSKQPTVNMNVMRNMVSPYGFGGEIDEDQMAQLQQMADDNGITVEELIQQLQDTGSEEESSEEDSTEDGEEFGTGGLVSTENDPPKRKKNKTLVPNNYGIYNGIVDENGKAIDVPTHDAALKTMVNYMLNNKPGEFTDGGSNVYRPEFQHYSINPKPTTPVAAYGMEVGKGAVPINVENQEVLQTPQGQLVKAKGATHEKGGIDVSVPEGTKVYSDRLKIGDKTMQQRKTNRERTLSRIQKILDKNPSDKILQNTFKRVQATTQAEESKDMAIQKVVNAIANGEMPEETPGTHMAYGGYAMKAFGDEIDPPVKWVKGADGIMRPVTSNYTPATGSFRDGNFTQRTTDGSITLKDTPESNNELTTINSGVATLQGLTVGNNTPSAYPPIDTTKIPGQQGDKGADMPSKETPSTNPGMGTGDYVGLLGNAFNAIAPILNTKKAAAATKPNINRFKGFGRNAIAANDTAQSYVSGVRANAKTDANTAANTAIAKNRNSATGVNTMRSLDIAVGMARDKAENNIDDTFSKSMIGLLTNRGQLENIKDNTIMSAQERTDTKDKQDTDNYYSNMAANLTNAGTNIQGMGKSLNKAKSNKINATLLAQLSQYGLGFDRNGNLITIKQ